MDLVTRRSTNSRSVTAKQSGDGCRFTLRNRDRGRQVAYREAVSGREKVTTDQIIKRHPFIDAFSAANGRKTPNTTIGPATGLIRSLANWCKRGATAALRVLLTMIRLITRGEYRKWPHLNNQRLSYSVFDRSLRRLRFQYAIREASCHRRRLLDSSPQR